MGLFNPLTYYAVLRFGVRQYGQGHCHPTITWHGTRTDHVWVCCSQVSHWTPLALGSTDRFLYGSCSFVTSTCLQCLLAAFQWTPRPCPIPCRVLSGVMGSAAAASRDAASWAAKSVMLGPFRDCIRLRSIPRVPVPVPNSCFCIPRG